MSESDEITLIVVEPAEAIAEDGAGLPAEDFDQESVKDIGRWLKAKSRPANLSDLGDRMTKVQAEVEQLLTKMKPSTAGYRLAEVQVGLAISGGGTIGVATVGAEASVSLTFIPPDKK